MDKKTRDRLNALLAGEREARADGNIESARNYILKISGILESINTDDAYDLWSRYSYEIGSLDRLEGNAESASKNFVMSADFALKSKQPLIAIFSSYQASLILYFIRRIDAGELYALIGDYRSGALELKETNVPDSGRFYSLEHEFLLRLTELSFEMRNGELERWDGLRVGMDHVNETGVGGGVRFDHFEIRTTAWREEIAGNFDRAAMLGLSYLDVVVDQIGVVESIYENIGDIREFVRDVAEETARDYRDCGSVLLRSSFPFRVEAAKTVFERGRRIPRSIDNQRYIEDIDRIVDGLG